MERKKKQDQFLSIQIDSAKGPPIKKQTTEQPKLYEGVQLSEKEKQYLLPHFLMMLVGKPGSGKTHAIRTLLNDSPYYFQKFDQVLLISPSATKMEIKVKKENMSQVFSLKWIEDKLFDMNKRQKERIIRRLRELKLVDKVEIDRLNGQLTDQMANEVNKRDPNQGKANILEDKERFFNPNFFKSMQARQQSQLPTKKTFIKKPGGGVVQQEQQQSLAQYVDELHQKFVLKLPMEERNKNYFNCLIVLDDMVSQIKAAEFDPLLTQLIFNRRHLIMNGMVSIIIVSQKYTMIPARIRSNSNWLVLFRLNPVDFENVYKDVVMLTQNQWAQLLEFVYGGVEKKYHSLGIWVEQDIFFMDFKQLNIMRAPEQQQQKMVSSELDLTEEIK